MVLTLSLCVSLPHFTASRVYAEGVQVRFQSVGVVGTGKRDAKTTTCRRKKKRISLKPDPLNQSPVLAVTSSFWTAVDSYHFRLPTPLDWSQFNFDSTQDIFRNVVDVDPTAELNREVNQLQKELGNLQGALQASMQQLFNDIQRESISESIERQSQVDLEAYSQSSKRSSQNESPESNHDELVCELCHEAHSEPRNQIVICDRCDNGFHQNCCGVHNIPEGDWVCPRCSEVDSQLKSTESPAKIGSVSVVDSGSCSVEDKAVRRSKRIRPEALWRCSQCQNLFKNTGSDVSSYHGVCSDCREVDEEVTLLEDKRFKRQRYDSDLESVKGSSRFGSQSRNKMSWGGARPGAGRKPWSQRSAATRVATQITPRPRRKVSQMFHRLPREPAREELNSFVNRATKSATESRLSQFQTSVWEEQSVRFKVRVKGSNAYLIDSTPRIHVESRPHTAIGHAAKFRDDSAWRSNQHDPIEQTFQLGTVSCFWCNSRTYSSSNQIVVCYGCQQGYHQVCADLNNVPNRFWLCPICEVSAVPPVKQTRIIHESTQPIQAVSPVQNPFANLFNPLVDPLANPTSVDQELLYAQIPTPSRAVFKDLSSLSPEPLRTGYQAQSPTFPNSCSPILSMNGTQDDKPNHRFLQFNDEPMSGELNQLDAAEYQPISVDVFVHNNFDRNLSIEDSHIAHGQTSPLSLSVSVTPPAVKPFSIRSNSNRFVPLQAVADPFPGTSAVDRVEQILQKGRQLRQNQSLKSLQTVSMQRPESFISSLLNQELSQEATGNENG